MTSALLVVAGFTLLTLPGGLVGAALGLRGWLLVGSTPALTIGTVGILGAWFGLLGIPWSIPTVVLGVLVLAATAAAVTRPWRPRAAPAGPRYEWRHHAAIAGALTATAALGALVVQRGTGRLRGIPQYWDAMFHANAVRHIAENGAADPASLAAIAQPANPEFYYPHSYHLLGALLFDAGVQPVQVVLNTLSACLPVVFALSLVALLRVVLPRPTTVVAGALVAGLFASFPYDLINFGPLLPLALAVAVCPAACGLLVLLVRTPSIASAAGLALSAVALLTTHPTVAVAAALVMALLLVVGSREDQVWRQPRRLLAVAAAGGAALLLAFPSLRGLTGVAGSATEIDWPAVALPSEAVGQLLLLGQESSTPQWWLAALVVLGALVALESRSVRPFALAAAAFLALFVLAAAYDTPTAQRLTAVWWNDRWRLAALYVVPAAVLAAVGLTWVKDRLQAVAVRTGVVRPIAVTWRGPAALASVALVLALLTHGGYRTHNTDRVAVPYKDGPTVSAGEQEAYEELARIWDGGAVLNDPADGSPWAYGLEGLPLVFKTPLTPPSDPEDFGAERNVLLERFSEDRDEDDVIDAIDRLDVRWVLVGEGFASPTASRAPGLRDLDEVSGLAEVWSNGAATIYRVDRSDS